MSDFRAKKGGEKGLNGEWYKGGEFMPAREDSIPNQNENKRKKLRKVAIANYKWVEERPNEYAIWGAVEQVSIFNQTGYDKETGSQGTLTYNEKFNPRGARWTGNVNKAVNQRKEMIEKWNNGERWVSKDWYNNYRDTTAINSLVKLCNEETSFKFIDYQGTLVMSYFYSGMEIGEIGVADLLTLTEQEKSKMNQDGRQNIKKFLNRFKKILKNHGLV